jgi:rod shape-determining protein MreC
LGAVILLTLVLLRLPNQTASQVKLAISGLFLPLFGLAGSTHHMAEKSAQALVPRQKLVKRLDQALKENQELQIKAAQADELTRENARLRQHLGMPKQLPWKVVLAEVVARDPANWARSIRINAGLREGVATNSPVLTADGLVGRVSEVGYTQAQVVLLGDPDCRVSVLIEETRDHGVISPTSSSALDNILVDLSYLSRNSLVTPGQRVVTSGLGGVFPKGILVGRIADSRSVGYGLYLEARVVVSAKLNALEEVWVKVP